jgi:hypothetical protein
MQDAHIRDEAKYLVGGGFDAWLMKVREVADRRPRGLNEIVCLEAFQQRFQRSGGASERLNANSPFCPRANALVYQAPDWACFINAIALNDGSIYGELVIAQAESTP